MHINAARSAAVRTLAPACVNDEPRVSPQPSHRSYREHTACVAEVNVTMAWDTRRSPTNITAPLRAVRRRSSGRHFSTSRGGMVGNPDHSDHRRCREMIGRACVGRRKGKDPEASLDPHPRPDSNRRAHSLVCIRKGGSSGYPAHHVQWRSAFNRLSVNCRRIAHLPAVGSVARRKSS